MCSTLAGQAQCAPQCVVEGRRDGGREYAEQAIESPARRTAACEADAGYSERLEEVFIDLLEGEGSLVLHADIVENHQVRQLEAVDKHHAR